MVIPRTKYMATEERIIPRPRKMARSSPALRAVTGFFLSKPSPLGAFWWNGRLLGNKKEYIHYLEALTVLR